MVPSKPFAAALAAAALALWAGLDFYSAMARTADDQYKIAQFLERYEPAVAMLPPRAAVGYLSDTTFDDVKGQVLYFTALYAVAPRKLIDSPDPGPKAEYVLGNFSILEWQPLAEKYPNLETFKDFGNGLVLLRRRN